MSEQITTPRHLGLVLDGNRRWAKAQGLPPNKGHEQGAETLKKIVRYGFNSGIQFITAFVFSSENWNRSKTEVKFLMQLILRLFKAELEDFIKDGYRIIVLGSDKNVPPKILEVIRQTEERTKNNIKGTLALCFNYSTDIEIKEAAEKMVQDIRSGAEVRPFREYLYHPEVPDLDLIVRTSGERRLSGFMLPRASYAELAFVPVNWPAFSAEDLGTVLHDYASRKRRFGK